MTPLRLNNVTLSAQAASPASAPYVPASPMVTGGGSTDGSPRGGGSSSAGTAGTANMAQHHMAGQLGCGSFYSARHCREVSVDVEVHEAEQLGVLC